MRVLGLEERGQDVPAVHVLLARPFGLQERVLDDALERLRVLGHLLARGVHGLHLLGEELFEVAHQRLGVAAALADDVARRLLVQQRVQQVFQRHVLVAPLDRLHRGDVERGL